MRSLAAKTKRERLRRVQVLGVILTCFLRVVMVPSSSSMVSCIVATLLASEEGMSSMKKISSLGWHTG